MTTPALKIVDRSARQRLADWIKATIEDDPEISEADVAALARRTFDDAFMVALANEMLATLVYDIVNVELRPTRVRSALRAMLQSKKPTGSERIRSVFAGWRESIEKDRKVQLMEMTYEDLTEAIKNRLAAAKVEIDTAEMFKYLRRRLKPGERIKNKWTNQEVLDAFAKYCNQ